MVRLATAAVLAPLLWLMIREAPPAAFIALALAVMALSAWECFRLFERKGARPFTWLGIVIVAWIGVSFASLPWQQDVAWPLTLAVLASTAGAMWLRDDPNAMVETAWTTLFPVLFVGLGLAHVIGLRSAPGEDGQDLVLLLFFCVTMADTAAYYVGRRWGRHRLAPNVSPKKSWEGFAGGLAASVVAALIAHLWFYRRLPLPDALALGVVLGLAAVLGDLAESMVKRATGAKDSSSLLPGHGGMLDRLDGLLFAGPVLYYYYHAFLEGPA